MYIHAYLCIYHVYTMYIRVCTILPNHVYVYRIPDDGRVRPAADGQAGPFRFRKELHESLVTPVYGALPIGMSGSQ